jgi:hypothetical protein
VGNLGVYALALACVLGVAGLIALAAVALVHAQKQERRRRTTLASWAGARHWQVYPDDRMVPWKALLPGRGRLHLLLTGTYQGRPAATADYSYTTTSSSGDSTTTTTHHYCAFVVHTRQRHPAVSVVSRGSGSKLWRNLTGPNRVEVGHPAFDERFKVVAADRNAARRVLGPQLVEAHLAGHLPDWHLYDQSLLTYHPGLLSPARIEAGLARTAAIADLIEPA